MIELIKSASGECNYDSDPAQSQRWQMMTQKWGRETQGSGLSQTDTGPYFSLLMLPT